MLMFIDGAKPMKLGAEYAQKFEEWRDYEKKSLIHPSVRSKKRSCDLCHQSLGKKFMRVLYTQSEDLVCHEYCWDDAHEVDLHMVVEKHFYAIEDGQLTIERIVVNEPDFVSSEEKEQVAESREEQLRKYNELCAEIAYRQRQKLLCARTLRVEEVSIPREVCKRNKELKELKATLDLKEPLRLTPVVYIASSTSQASAEQNTITCNLCNQVIDTMYVQVKPRNGSNFLCHETCWKICDYNTEERLKEISRVCRYQANGKLLDKVAFAAPTIAVIASPPQPILPQPIVVKTEERTEPTEYKPSWREVDVHGYEMLKKNNEKLQQQLEKKREKRRLRAANKASRYLDLASVSAPTVRPPVSKEIFMGACITSIADDPVPTLSASAKEYVPLSACSPANYYL